MKVRRLPVDPGVSGWSAVLPPAPPPAQLNGRRRADYLIIGGGFAGLAAARRLRRVAPDADVVLLEAGRVGEGPAGRNSGFMIDLPHELGGDSYAGAAEADRAQTRANRAAIAFAAEAATDYGMDGEVFAPVGKVNGAASDQGLRHNRDYAAHLESLGETHRLLSAAEMQAMTGSAYYAGGLFTPGTAMIHPAAFVRAMAAGVAGEGVVVHEASPVVALSPSGEGWVAETPEGAVTASRVILAVNGHAESFERFAGRLIHVHLYASMTRPLTAAETATLGGEARWGITPADPAGTTVRRISGVFGGDRIVVRNRATYDPSMSAPQGAVARAGREHDRAFRARFPILDGVEMEHRWGGRLCLSLNSAPAFGEVAPGLFAACCQNGLGAAQGTLAGMLAADQAVGGQSEALTWMLSRPGPKHLPPPPLARIGAWAAIRWREMKAGAEL